MIINGEELIARQLSVSEVTRITFDGGHETTIHPVSYIPQLCGENNRVSIDGDWQVTRWPFAEDESTLASLMVNDNHWETVMQPGKVFTQDVETAAATISGWDRIGLSHLDPEDGAVIRKVVAIPDRWSGKRIYLTFDGIYPGGRIYLNGILLGEHTSGLTPVEYDVTDLVTPGKKALVAVRLLRRHPFVKMDMPRHAGEFAGISQNAYFHATDDCQIADYHVIASLNDDLSTGTLSGNVTVRNLSEYQRSGEVSVKISDSDKGITWENYFVLIESNSTITIPVSLTVDNPKLWNDEYPNLYNVSITLKLPGEKDQTTIYRTGFRRFDLSGGLPKLNGNPVKFRGVNHLTYHPEFGMYTPESWLRECLILMKKANVNCIRTHYLGPRYLADLCDELGIYLLQELPIDWGTDYIADPLWVGPAMQRIHGGIIRDRHHASVMVWSIGNENMPSKQAEAEDGYNHMKIYNQFAKLLDHSRPTMFPPPGPANTIRGILELRNGDIADTHYSFNHIKNFLKNGVVENPIAWDGGMQSTTREEAIANGWSGVWYSSEYGIANLIPDLLHAPYGDIISDVPENQDSGRSSLEVFTDRLRREWGYMREEPSCLGGAYFPWICGAAGANPWGWTVWAEDNDWGIVTADLLPKPFFWAMRVLFSPVWFPEQVEWHDGENEITFELNNQFNAINLNQCTIRTMLSWAKGACTREWRDILVNCAPGKSCTVTVPIWNNSARESLNKGITTVMRVVIMDPKGFRILTHDIMITPQKVEKDEVKELLIGPDAKL